MKKVTSVAPANIALIKYWGMSDASRVLPTNPSISMTLTHCVSRCTVERMNEDASGDQIEWLNAAGHLEPAPRSFCDGVQRHLDVLRAHTRVSAILRVATTNSFPTGAGMASSASGFAALTVATCAALGAPTDAAELSTLARLSGSGSAARSILGGFVQWPHDPSDPEGAACSLAPSDHWRLYDVVAIVDASPKAISSREGHRRAPTSPYFARRLEILPARTQRVREALLARNFVNLAEAVEEEAIDLHLIAMSANPPIFYWQPGTLAVLDRVRRLRAQGIDACATIDAGPNVHVLCTEAYWTHVRDTLASVPEVKSVLVDEIGDGVRLVNEHLF